MSCMKGGNRITKRSDPSADDAPKTKKIPLTDVGRFLKCAKVVQNNALGAVTSIPLNLRWYSDGNPNKLSPKFDPERFNKELGTMSPKVLAMMNTIEKLDVADLTGQDQTLFKHFIYTELDEFGSNARGDYGINLVISALTARGYTNMLTENLDGIKPALPEEENKARKTFVYLSATTLQRDYFDANYKHQGRKFKDYVRDTFNSKDNAFGQHIRFIVLSKNFREGLDLFDVKYGHLLEPMTKSQETQAMGRGTRRCGQRNLKFRGGWDLHVYRYLLYVQPKLRTEFGWPEHYEDMMHSFSSGMNVNDFLMEVFQSVAEKSAIDRGREIRDPYVEETSVEGQRLLKELREQEAREAEHKRKKEQTLREQREVMERDAKILKNPEKALEEVIAVKKLESKDQTASEKLPTVLTLDEKSKGPADKKK